MAIISSFFKKANSKSKIVYLITSVILVILDAKHGTFELSSYSRQEISNVNEKIM